MNNKFGSEIVKYTVAGIIFGMIYPFLSTSIEIFEHNLPLNFSSFISVQRQIPLLWIADTALFALGFFGYQIGVRQQKLANQAKYLEDLVVERSEEILRQKTFYEALVENSPIAIVTSDPKHRIVSVNPAFEDIFGFHSKEIVGLNLDDLISNPENKQEAFDLSDSVLNGNTVHKSTIRRRKDGTLVEVEIYGEPIEIDGKRIGVLGLYRDITSENKARAELLASEERFRRMFQDSPVALRLEDLSRVKEWILQKQADTGKNIRQYLEENPEEFHVMCELRKITSLNSASLFLFRAKNKEDLQANYSHVLSEESRKEHLDIICQLLEGKTTLEEEMIYKNLEGKKLYVICKLTILPGSEDNWNRVVFSNTDITERKLSEERLEYISLHDSLTGLYNRAFFEEELSRLGRSRLRPISILVCDMDNLKEINDLHGHQAGDNAIQYVADLLKRCFRDSDMIARIGGDEFSVLLPNLDEEHTKHVYKRIIKHINLHNKTNNEKNQISVSIGCATANEGDLLEDTFKIADQNMYNEKQSKKK